MKRLIKKAEESEMITLYHGTSDVFYRDIKENGLQGINQHGNKITEQNAWGMDVVSRDGVYLTNEIDLAENYAYRAVSNVGGDKMIVTVQVDVNKLRKDDDFETLIREVDGGYTFDVFDTFISEEEYENLPYGLLSLKAVHCCYYDGAIPPSQIIEIDSNISEEDELEKTKEKASDILYDNGWIDSKNIGFWQKENNPLWITFEDEYLEIYSPNSAETPIVIFDYEKVQDALLFVEENTDKYV